MEIFAEAYKKRSAIIQDLNKKIKYANFKFVKLKLCCRVDVLLIAGAKSKLLKKQIHSTRRLSFVVSKIIIRVSFQMLPGLCSIIKIEEVCEPLIEAVDRVTDAVLLFCQVLKMINLYLLRIKIFSGYWPHGLAH